MSKYSEKKERQRMEMIKEAVAKERAQVDHKKERVQVDHKAEEANVVARKVELMNNLIEMSTLFKKAESELSEAFSFCIQSRFKHFGMRSLLKKIEVASMLSMEKVYSSGEMTNTLVDILRKQTEMSSLEVDSPDDSDQPDMEEES